MRHTAFCARQSDESRVLENINFKKQYPVQTMMSVQDVNIKIQASGVMSSLSFQRVRGVSKQS